MRAKSFHKEVAYLDKNMNPNNSTQPKPKIPVICGWLLIIGGVWALIFFLLAGFLGGFAIHYVGVKVFLQTIYTYGLPGAAALITGIGLKEFRHWVLYVLPLMCLVGLYASLVFADLTYFALLVVTLIGTGYAWTHRNLFR